MAVETKQRQSISLGGISTEVVVEEGAQDANLGSLVGQGLAAGGVGIAASLLLVETFKGGHEAGAPATSAGRATVVGGSWVLRRLRHDGEDGLCVRDQTFDGI
jgi:hypothetical protein